MFFPSLAQASQEPADWADLPTEAFAIVGDEVVVVDPSLIAELKPETIQTGLESLNEHWAAGRVKVSQSLKVTVTGEGRAWAKRVVEELYGGCARLAEVRASLIGLRLDTVNVCNETEPRPSPPTDDPVAGDDGPITIQAHNWGCWLRTLAWAISLAAFVFAPGWGWFWINFAMAAWTGFDWMENCFHINSLWGEKRNGWKQASWNSDSDWDSHGYPHSTEWYIGYSEYV